MPYLLMLNCFTKKKRNHCRNLEIAQPNLHILSLILHLPCRSRKAPPLAGPQSDRRRGCHYRVHGDSQHPPAEPPAILWSQAEGDATVWDRRRCALTHRYADAVKRSVRNSRGVNQRRLPNCNRQLPFVWALLDCAHWRHGHHDDPQHGREKRPGLQRQDRWHTGHLGRQRVYTAGPHGQWLNSIVRRHHIQERLQGEYDGNICERLFMRLGLHSMRQCIIHGTYSSTNTL